ncbi:GNAT family N-acetyltransferase [Brevibacterium sp. UCMA 11752]|uniref:GNAT family N-acetyltransferase n=1 Tax=Brevibacterium sp. UCMA 11752 TaxID=2745946 RepID=UPI001F480D33|nr:GNAT family N-acetyltransferase [Brevibacterium sp. UCMA 11752]
MSVRVSAAAGPPTTDRLHLRAYRESDAEALLPVMSREDISEFLLLEPWTAEVARTEVAKRIPRIGLETEWTDTLVFGMLGSDRQSA